MYFTSPVSNISPAMASIAMSRSDSRDSQTSSYNHHTNQPMSAYQSLATYAAMPWPMSRTNSAASTTSQQSPRAISMRRDSSSSSVREINWSIACPYRSAYNGSDVPSSYLTDEDLSFITPTSHPLPIEHISNIEPVLTKRELTTEEQIALLREQQEKEDEVVMVRHRDEKRRAVRFAEAGVETTKKARRPSTLKRRATPRRQFNGPQ